MHSVVSVEHLLLNVSAAFAARTRTSPNASNIYRALSPNSADPSSIKLRVRAYIMSYPATRIKATVLVISENKMSRADRTPVIILWQVIFVSQLFASNWWENSLGPRASYISSDTSYIVTPESSTDKDTPPDTSAACYLPVAAFSLISAVEDDAAEPMSRNVLLCRPRSTTQRVGFW